MINLSVKSVFFDRAKIEKEVERGRRKALSRAGAFVRRTARSSIRRRKNASRPGQPPTSQTGDLRKILFAYDPVSRGVVVGPVKFKSGNAPEVLESGGVAVIRASRSRGRKRPARRVKIEARPFMAPALDKNKQVFADSFRDIVRGGL